MTLSMDFFFYLAAITMIVGGIIVFDFFIGSRKIKYLKNMRALDAPHPPRISIIIPACNEEATIEDALQSVLAIDYEPLEIIVVNDRSTDATGSILDGLASGNQRLQVLHIKELPPQWLGKCHALFKGAQQATGDYLLFTDADVFFEKSVLKRSLNHILDKDLDHLSLIFGVPGMKGLLGVLILEVLVGLFVMLKPWKAKGPSSRYFMGVGAFNLVKSSSYWQCGGHQKIAMCPVDDIMLGKLIKRHGFRQDCLYGQDYVLVQWYSTVREMMNGLMKNSFGSFDYSLGRILLASVALVIFTIWPLLSLFFVTGAAFVLNSLLVIFRLLFWCFLAHTIKMRCAYAIWAVVTPYLVLYMMWKAALLTIYHKGITWRGTFYSLNDLKEGIYN